MPDHTDHDDMPKIVTDQYHYASYSLDAVQELIFTQLGEELSGRTDILLDEWDEEGRRTLVEDAGQYVLGVHSLDLSAKDRAYVFDGVYKTFFGFGPLDHLISDEKTVLLSINGHRRVSVQRRNGNLETVSSPFQTEADLQTLITRIVAAAGVDLALAEAVFEVGLPLNGRQARISIMQPPAVPMMIVDVRLHPRQWQSLDQLQTQGVISANARAMLDAIIAGNYGMLIVGPAGSGKTTLLGALLMHLGESLRIIEHAAELPVTDKIQRYAPYGGDQHHSYESLFAEVVKQPTDDFLLDEIRVEDMAVVWDALSIWGVGRCFATFRGALEAERVHAALSMAVQRVHPTLPQSTIDRALVAHFPFMVFCEIGDNGMHIHAIHELVFQGDRLTVNPLVVNDTIVAESSTYDLDVP